MAEFFKEFDFVQFLNPLYALPIVAVLICAFLVYAFGFKSPVQPPSFDDIEVEKKVKKRKAKESHKNKQQNGKATNCSSKTSDSATPGQKKKAEKNIAVEKAVRKNENKGKKTSVPEKKKKPSVNPESIPVTDDGNDDGWIHLQTKKGRKKKKKDDVALIADSAQPVYASSEMSFLGTTAEVENSTSQVIAVLSESKQNIDSGSLEDNNSEKKIPLDAKTSVKSPVPKKQRAKKKDANANSEKSEVGRVAAEEEKYQNDLAFPAAVESEPSEVAPGGATKSARKKESKKKKKKIEIAAEKENVADNKSSDTPPSNISVDSSNDVGLPAVKAFESTNNHISVKAEELDEPESMKPTLTEDKANEKSTEVSDAKSSNVAFDELEGMYPETKAQKKRKKVRREH